MPVASERGCGALRRMRATGVPLRGLATLEPDPMSMLTQRVCVSVLDWTTWYLWCLGPVVFKFGHWPVLPYYLASALRECPSVPGCPVELIHCAVGRPGIAASGQIWQA